MSQRTRFLKTALKKAVLPTVIIGTGVALVKYRHLVGKLNLKNLSTSLSVGLVGTAALATVATPAYAQISEQAVSAYAQSMQAAANSQNISQISRLLADDAVISLSRQGKGSSTLSKNDYLDLLQKSWTQSKDYRYEISVSDVVVTGDSARAVIVTRESWTKDGKAQTITTTSRATLSHNGKNAVLVRAVSQVVVN